MYGIPTNLPLQSFIGKECDQIAVGKFQIQFQFEHNYNLNVQGSWEMCDAANERVDGFQDHAGRETYRVHKILGSPVVRFVIDAPRAYASISAVASTLRR